MLVAVLIVATVALLLAAHSLQKNAAGRAAITLVSVVFMCYVFPKAILRPDYYVRHVGIAAAEIVVNTAIIVLVAAFAVNLITHMRWVGWRLVVPAAVWLLIGTWMSWERSSEHDAGLLQLASGLLAWLVGASCGYGLKDDPSVRKRAATWLTGLLGLQAIVVLVQIAGYNVNAMDRASGSLLEGRYNGTLTHPNGLAAATLMVFVLILALRGTAAGVRDGGTFAIFALVIGICLAAESRTQIVGAILLFVSWNIFAYRQTAVINKPAVVDKRLVAVVIVTIGVLASYPVLARRFEEDSVGGARSYLQEAALKTIIDQPGFGVGPNSYVSVVGLSDPLTATGVPVHNIFLMTAAELGIVGAVALWMPVVWTFVRGWRLRREPGSVRGAAAASAAYFLPFMVYAFTQWISGPIFPLIMVAMGAVYGLMALPPRSRRGLHARPVTRMNAA